MKTKKRIAINGLGRIGRHVLKLAIESGLNIVAVNDLTSIENLVYLLKYDSMYGNYDKKIDYGKDYIKIGKQKIKVLQEKNPENLPWKDLKVDIVVEATGLFTEREKAKKHLRAGANKVLITAPGKNSDVTIAYGINDNKLKKEHKIISPASCTTNCLVPIVKVLNDKFGIEKGFMTTVHAYTNNQNVLDAPSKKLRRGRTAGQNIVPTTTGATKALSLVLPEMKNKISGMAMRVPIAVGSIVDLIVELDKKTTKEEINREFKKQAKGKLKNILKYSEEPLVSSDIINSKESSILDALSTEVNNESGKTMAKVLSWYDNETGYSNRVIDVLKKMKGM